jgi:uncharacterized protein YkwD
MDKVTFKQTSALVLLVGALAALVACGSSSSGSGGDGGAGGAGVGSGTGDGTTSAASDGGSTVSVIAADGATESLEEHTRDVINAYRADAGTAPLALDDALGKFALAGSTELSQDHVPHGHFVSASNDGTLFSQGFSGAAAENEGDPDGDPFDGTTTGESADIDSIVKDMFDEGPGGGHHDNMLDPKSTRLGVGLVISGGKLYFTNDFSP